MRRGGTGQNRSAISSSKDASNSFWGFTKALSTGPPRPRLWHIWVMHFYLAAAGPHSKAVCAAVHTGIQWQPQPSVWNKCPSLDIRLMSIQCTRAHYSAVGFKTTHLCKVLFAITKNQKCNKLNARFLRRGCATCLHLLHCNSHYLAHSFNVFSQPDLSFELKQSSLY